MGLCAVAELSASARLGPTGLGVVDRGGARHGLTCDCSDGGSNVRVGEYETVSIFTQEPVRTIRPKDQRLRVGQDIVLAWSGLDVGKSVRRVRGRVAVCLRRVCRRRSSPRRIRSTACSCGRRIRSGGGLPMVGRFWGGRSRSPLLVHGLWGGGAGRPRVEPYRRLCAVRRVRELIHSSAAPGGQLALGRPSRPVCLHNGLFTNPSPAARV